MNFFKKQPSQNSQQSKNSIPSSGRASNMPVPAPGQTRSSHSPVPQFVGGGGVGGAPVFDVEEEEEGDEEGSYYDEDDDFLAADESGIPHHDAGMPGASQVYPPGYPPVQQPPVGPYGQPQYPGPNHYQDPYLQSDDRSYNGSMYPPGPVPGPMGSAYNMDQIMNDPMYPPTMNPYGGPGYGAPIPPPPAYGAGGGENEIAMYLAQGYTFDEAVAMLSGGAAHNPYMADMSMYGGAPPSSGSFYGGSSAYGAPGFGGGPAPGYSAGGGGGGYGRDGNEEEFQAALRRSLEEDRERQARVNETQREAMEAVERANEKALQIALQRSFEEFEEQQRVRTSMPNVDPYAVDRANDDAFEAARLASLRESLPPPPPISAAQYPIGGVVAKTLVRVGSDTNSFQNAPRTPAGGDQRIASQSHYMQNSQQVYGRPQGGPNGPVYEQQGYNQNMQIQAGGQMHTPAHQGSGLLAMRHHPGAPSPAMRGSPVVSHQNSNQQGSGLLNLRSRSIDNNDPAASPAINPNNRSGSGLLGLRSRSNDHGDGFSPVPAHLHQGLQPHSRSDSFDENDPSPAAHGGNGAQPSSGLLAYRKQHPNAPAGRKVRSSNNSVGSDQDNRSAGAMRVAQAAVRSDHKPNPLGKPRMSIHRMMQDQDTHKEQVPLELPAHDDDNGSYESSDDEAPAPRQSQGKQGSVVANAIMQKRANPLGNPRMSIHRMTDEAQPANNGPRLTPSINNRPAPSAEPTLQPNPNNPLFKAKR